MLLHDQFPTTQQLQTALEVFSIVLQTPKLAAVMGEKDQTNWVCTAIGAVHQLLKSGGSIASAYVVQCINYHS